MTKDTNIVLKVEAESLFSLSPHKRNTKRKTRIIHIMVTENKITTELFVIEKEEGIVTNKT
jgi:hypothetical protein